METHGTAVDAHVAAKKAALVTIEAWNSAKRIGPGRAATAVAGPPPTPEKPSEPRAV